MSLEGSTNMAMAKSMDFLLQFCRCFFKKPTWTILAGDRGEQLAAAIACSYSYTLCTHTSRRSGNIDGVARHAIGKLVHLHFASNKEAADRLLRLGEQSFRIHNVGAPQLDEIQQEYIQAQKINKSIQLLMKI